MPEPPPLPMPENSGEPTARPTVDISEPIETGAFFERLDWQGCLITWVVLMAVYLWTISPSIGVGDEGYYTTAASSLGVPNPPGFPVWTVYAWCFTKLLPFGNLAWRVNVSSAFATALSCGLVALLVSSGGKVMLATLHGFQSWSPREQNQVRLICGIVSGLGLGLSGTAWWEALHADVFAFRLLLLTSMLCLMLRWMARPQQKKFLYAVFYVFGLVLTGNQELFLLLPWLMLCIWLVDGFLCRDLFCCLLPVLVAGSLLEGVPFIQSMDFRFGSFNKICWVGAVLLVIDIVRVRRVGKAWKAVTCCVIVLGLGLAWCFLSPVASMTTPPGDWAYPRTVEGFFHLISRGQYERTHPTDSLERAMDQLYFMPKAFGSDFGWVYMITALLSFGIFLRTDKILRKWLVGLLAMLLCTGPIMIATLNPSPNRSSIDLHLRYFATFYAVVAVCSGLGLILLANWFSVPKQITIPENV